MKNIAEQIKRIIFAVMLATTVAACSEDNIEDIFVEREWKLTYVNDGGVKRFTKDKVYSIQFFENSFKATLPGGGTINGNWSANGNTREFRCSNIRTSGHFAGDTIAEKMIQILTNAKKYEGDTNWLQIKQQENVFMQFYN